MSRSAMLITWNHMSACDDRWSACDPSNASGGVYAQQTQAAYGADQFSQAAYTQQQAQMAWQQQQPQW